MLSISCVSLEWILQFLVAQIFWIFFLFVPISTVWSIVLPREPIWEDYSKKFGRRHITSANIWIISLERLYITEVIPRIEMSASLGSELLITRSMQAKAFKQRQALILVFYGNQNLGNIKVPFNDFLLEFCPTRDLHKGLTGSPCIGNAGIGGRVRKLVKMV